MAPLRSLFIDFNSYFAAVEQQDDARLRGRPVAVRPVASETTCCIAASYEARAFGVRTGTGIREARGLCPGLVVVEARPPRYVEVHQQAVACVDRVVPVQEVVSIDEMACELPTRWRTPEAAERIARTVKARILAEVGDQLRTSVGIAANRLLAKAASNLQKPDGLVLMPMEALPRLLHPLPVSALNGVGPRMAERLARQGITTMAQLCAATPEALRLAWGGVQGVEIHDQLRGCWTQPRHSPKRSMSHSHVLPPAMRHPQAAYGVLCALLHKAATRLRHEGYFAGTLAVHLRTGGAHRGVVQAREARVGQTQDSVFLQHSLDALWADGLARVARPLHVGVVLGALVPAAQHTPSLFDAPAGAGTPRHRPALLAAMDALNRRYGRQTLVFASAHAGKAHTPMRIAFTRIPDAALES